MPASDDAEQPPDDKEPRGDQYLPEGKEPGDPSQPPARNGYKPAAGGSEAPAGGSDATGAKPVPASDPAGHLAALKAKLDKEQKRLLELEPLKTSTADLAQRIATLEKAAEGQAAAASTYKDFYRTTEVALHEIKCFIPTVRCQLDEIKDKQKACTGRRPHG